MKMVAFGIGMQAIGFVLILIGSNAMYRLGYDAGVSKNLEVAGFEARYTEPPVNVSDGDGPLFENVGVDGVDPESIEFFILWPDGTEWKWKPKRKEAPMKK